jgi:hypothetical protein
MLILVLVARFAATDFVAMPDIGGQPFHFGHSHFDRTETFYEMRHILWIFWHFLGQSVDLAQHMVVFSPAFQFAHSSTMTGFPLESGDQNWTILTRSVRAKWAPDRSPVAPGRFTRVMDFASLAISLGALVAVVVIGVRSLRQGEKVVRSAEESTGSSLRAAVASERAASVAESDARIRRLERLMDLVLEMRELFNDQITEHGSIWVPGYYTPETLARTALNRKLEAGLVIFRSRTGMLGKVFTLTTTHNWNSTILEEAIEEIKVEILREMTGLDVADDE